MLPGQLLKTVPLALLGGLALAAAPLRPYCNPRFGYCVSVPSELRAMPPPENGDGLRWESADGGVSVTAWGSFGPEGLGLKTLRQYADWLLSAERQDGSRVTYRFVGRNFVVLSGHNRAGQVFYQKSLLRAGGESAVRTEYPPRLKAEWDARATQIAASLTAPNAP